MPDGDNSLQITEITHENLKDVNSTDTAFRVKSRVIPHIVNGKFQYTLEKLPESYTKSYENDELDYSTYIENPDKTIYLAYVGSTNVGQIILRRNWNRFAYIEDIRVGSEYRRKGIGRKLIDRVIEWAKKGNMPGIMLETQDTNVSACKLYESAGFVLGGIDTMLYGAAKKYSHEKALFWYLVF